MYVVRIRIRVCVFEHIECVYVRMRVNLRTSTIGLRCALRDHIHDVLFTVLSIQPKNW